MKFSTHFLWFDFWVGWFWDRTKRVLYVCPLPCVVLKFDFGKKLTFGEMVDKAGSLPSSFLAVASTDGPKDWSKVSDEDLEEACIDDEDIAAIHEYYERQQDRLRVERDKAVNDLEQLKKNIGIDVCPYIFCENPRCPKHGAC